jgi:hypothetical protein
MRRPIDPRPAASRRPATIARKLAAIRGLSRSMDQPTPTGHDVSEVRIRPTANPRMARRSPSNRSTTKKTFR